ncbi:MAG: HEPN domain-containing protein [Lachnospiraceae bacterium]|nr:HEPN domain-containing protein [Lachnospiraceae bacterium]
MEDSLKQLAGYRLARAKEMLSASECNLEAGQYRTSLNRSYYAIFHAMRLANVLKRFDSSKHSGVIAFFTKEYLKTEILERNLAAVIKESSLCREKSDYDDFYVAGREEAEEQLKNAKYFVQKIEEYVNAVNE